MMCPSALADTATKNNKKLKSLYAKALQIKSAIPHPKIMGVIRECGGKMHMAQVRSPPPTLAAATPPACSARLDGPP